MSVDERTLQIEITIVPSKRRKGGQRSSDAEAKSGDAPQIPRITRLMALAIKFQDMVDRGEVRDYADFGAGLRTSGFRLRSAVLAPVACRRRTVRRVSKSNDCWAGAVSPSMEGAGATLEIFNSMKVERLSHA